MSFPQETILRMENPSIHPVVQVYDWKMILQISPHCLQLHAAINLYQFINKDSGVAELIVPLIATAHSWAKKSVLDEIIMFDFGFSGNTNKSV
jgi:hypothetical protein